MIDVDKMDNYFENKKIIVNDDKRKKTSKIEIGYTPIKREYRLRNRIFEWSKRDFLIFINGHLLMKTNNVLLRCRVLGVAYNQISKTMDLLVDEYGFCDNVVFKDYIDYFFDQYFNYLYKKYNDFNLSWLSYPKNILNFSKQYNYYDSSVEKYQSDFIPRDPYYFPVKSQKNIPETYLKFLERSVNIFDRIQSRFQVSEELALMEYGPILIYKYLCRERDDSQAVLIVKDLCDRVIKKKQGKLLIDILLQYAPYDSEDLLKLSKIIKKLQSIREFSIGKK